MYRELTYAWKAVIRRPLHALAAVVTLALGIGASSAAFNVINGVLLNPLPYPDSERIVAVRHSSQSFKNSKASRLRERWNRLPLSYLNYRDIQEQSPVFEEFGIYRPWKGVYQGGSEPIEVRGAQVSSRFLNVFGLAALKGRLIGAPDIEGRNPVAVISYDFWQTSMGGQGTVVGGTLRFDQDVYEVIGVMPPKFEISPQADHKIFLPLIPSESDLQRRGRKNAQALARLSAGTSIEEARQVLDQIAARLESTYPEANEGIGIVLEPLHEIVVGESRSTLALLGAAVAVVLLIACANVGSLLWTDYLRRRHQFAIRLSLGASRARIVRLLMTENLLLAAGASIAGFLLASFGTFALVAYLPDEVPRTANIAIDAKVFAFTVAVSLLSTFLFGLIPALRISRASSASDLNSVRGSRRLKQAHRWILVPEMALTIILLVQAGLLVNSLLRLTSVDPGLSVEGIHTQGLQLDSRRYQEEEQAGFFYSQLLERLKALPSVKMAAASSQLPFTGGSYQVSVQSPDDPGSGQPALLESVSSDYFQLLKIPLRKGRFFNPSDRLGSPSVALLNESLAEAVWPNADPLGREIADYTGATHTVVGIVGDVKSKGLDVASNAIFYRPLRQAPATSVTLVVEPALEADDVSAQVRHVIHELDSGLPLPAAAPLEDLVARSLAVPRSRTALLGIFAAMALLIAAVGLYGVMAFSVTQQRKDLGIRLALGASKSRVQSMVLRQLLSLVVPGVVLGLLGAFLASQLLRGLLFGIETTDPATYLVVAVSLTLVALLAGLLPAVRAARLDPSRTLRAE
ncbi:MAG TPA: ABC transporter permease [Acidobacteriota bacterium]|nr:ABC transporter permease [Acidobacteriota bacterium]